MIFANHFETAPFSTVCGTAFAVPLFLDIYSTGQWSLPMEM